MRLRRWSVVGGSRSSPTHCPFALIAMEDVSSPPSCLPLAGRIHRWDGLTALTTELQAQINLPQVAVVTVFYHSNGEVTDTWGQLLLGSRDRVLGTPG